MKLFFLYTTCLLISALSSHAQEVERRSLWQRITGKGKEQAAKQATTYVIKEALPVAGRGYVSPAVSLLWPKYVNAPTIGGETRAAEWSPTDYLPRETPEQRRQREDNTRRQREEYNERSLRAQNQYADNYRRQQDNVARRYNEQQQYYRRAVQDQGRQMQQSYPTVFGPRARPNRSNDRSNRYRR